MQDEKIKNEVSNEQAVIPPHERMHNWVLHIWRPAASALAVVLAVLLTWHVVTGKNGVSVWQKKRVEDHQLQKEIKQLQQENDTLRNRIEHLKSDPDAIEREAREKLHYAKPGEVIYALPSQTQQQSQAKAGSK
jgi:cell division protein FtsB